MNRMTFDDLIARKLQREQDKYAIKEIKVGDKNLVFKRLTNKQQLDCLNNLNQKSGISDAVQIYKEMIYDSCEILHDTKLHKECEVIDPIDIVDVLFDISDIISIGDELTEFNGLASLGEEIKN